jgi:hypothetical protein
MPGIPLFWKISDPLVLQARFFFQQLISGVSYCHAMVFSNLLSMWLSFFLSIFVVKKENQNCTPTALVAICRGYSHYKYFQEGGFLLLKKNCTVLLCFVTANLPS